MWLLHSRLYHSGPALAVVVEADLGEAAVAVVVALAEGLFFGWVSWGFIEEKLQVAFFPVAYPVLFLADILYFVTNQM